MQGKKKICDSCKKEIATMECIQGNYYSCEGCSLELAKKQEKELESREFKCSICGTVLDNYGKYEYECPKCYYHLRIEPPPYCPICKFNLLVPFD